MEIAEILILGLTLIAVCVGLYINHKNNSKLNTQLKDFEYKTTQGILNLRTELIDSFKVLSEENKKQINNLSSDVKNYLNEKTEQINMELTTRIDNLGKTINYKIDTTKTDLMENYEMKSSKTIEDLQNLYVKNQKEIIENIEAKLKIFNTENNTKIESALATQKDQQIRALASINEKFQVVINEIKSPLGFD
jgi:hypothetical protein